MAALQNSGAAITGALLSGNPLGAAQALFHAPGNVVNGFLYGHETISETIAAPSGSGLQSLTANVPVGGALTELNDLSLTLTPTGGGAPTTIPLTGVQVGGLFTALQNGASLPAQALAGHSLLAAALAGDPGAFTVPVIDQDTPFGRVQLTLGGTASPFGLTLDSGSLLLPKQLTLAVDALGAPYNAYLALGASGPALVGAVESGNVLGAANILAHAPNDVLRSFLYGQSALTLSVPGASGFSELGLNVPMDGLLVHGPDAVTLTATPTGGAPTTIALSGTQFSGLGPALLQAGGLPALETGGLIAALEHAL